MIKCVTLLVMIMLGLPHQLCKADDINVQYFYNQSRYDMQAQIADLYDYANTFINYMVRCEYRDDLRNGDRLNYGISYSHSMTSEYMTITDGNSIDAPGSINYIEASTYYSFDIVLKKNFILNPEVGPSLQFPIISKNKTSREVNYKHVSPPVLGINLNVWLKYRLKRNQEFGFGVSGCLPFYHVAFGTYQLDENSPKMDLKSSFGYIGVGFCYSFGLNIDGIIHWFES